MILIPEKAQTFFLTPHSFLSFNSENPSNYSREDLQENQHREHLTYENK